MKRKIWLIALTFILVLSVAGCGKKDSGSDAGSSNSNAVSNSSSQSTDAKDAGLEYETEGEYIVFSVSTDYELESDAWLGVVPTGKIFTKEVDADEVDIVYTYCENWDFDGIKSYRFPFDKDYFESIEDGIYDMVLCSSDSEETGKVLIQFGIEKKGSKITLDFENKK